MNSSENLAVSNPRWFLQPEVMGNYLPHAGTLGCADWPGAGITRSQGIPPCFYLPHVNMGLPIPLPPPLRATPNLCASLPSLRLCPLLASG